MKTKSMLQKTALTMAFACLAPWAMAQSLTLPGFLSMDDTGSIGNVPYINSPSLDGDTWTQLADFVAPVANFTGFDINGNAIAPADLIPLRTTSLTIVDPATGNVVNTIGGNGQIGIGTNNPLAPLHVAAANGSYTHQGDYTFYHDDGLVVTGVTPAFTYSNASIFAEGSIISRLAVQAPYMLAVQNCTFSDVRLKNVENLSDAKQDLDTLRKIEVTNYTMKDRIQFGDRKFKKVIAQQVQSVFPQAINEVKGVLPDVMKLAETRTGGGGSLQVILPEASMLKIGDRVEFVSANGQREVSEIITSNNSSVTVKLKQTKAGEKVFVYGREVNDVRSVDYEALSMLNVSATQELSKEVEALKAENAKLNAALAKMEALEKAVAALEGKSTETVTVSLVK